MVYHFLVLNSKASTVVNMQVAPDSFTLFSDYKVVKKKKGKWPIKAGCEEEKSLKIQKGSAWLIKVI